jgi:glucose/arabinose dehydrogenase
LLPVFHWRIIIVGRHTHSVPDGALYVSDDAAGAIYRLAPPG